MKKIKIPAPMAKQRNLRFLVDHENLAHLLPSIELMIIARKKNHIQDNTQQHGKLEPTTFLSYNQIYIFTIQYPYNIQACYDFPINTLWLDSTHPDTYNLVGFSGCLHLWLIPLLTPELCVTSVIMNQFPSPQESIRSKWD